MRLVIAGSSGLIGTALVASLRGDGHDVSRLVRRKAAGPDELEWDPERGAIDVQAMSQFEAVVNLCGVGIGDKRWSGAYKQEIRDSRIASTEVLAGAVAAAGVPTLINASAVGYYGDTGDRILDESAPAGSGFLADVCRDWELATAPAHEAGVRVVVLRTGPVISPSGGLLSRLRLIYKLGLGGRLGNGRQYLAWISLEDAVEAIKFIAMKSTFGGPANLTGPAPISNAQFNQELARAVHRPAPLIVPRFALRVAVGEFAEEGVLSGQRAIPKRLEEAGFVFRHSTIGQALAAAFAERTS